MADEKLGAGARQAKPSSKILIGAAFVLAALILAAAYYWFMPASQAQPVAAQQQEPDLLQRPGAVALLDALQKQENMSEKYHIEYYQVDPLGQVENFVVDKNGGMGLASIKNDVYTQDFFFGNGKTIACLTPAGENRKCAKYYNNSDFLKKIEAANSSLIFFDRNASVENAQAANQLIRNAVIQFSGDPSESEVAGRKCVNMTYQYDAPVAAGQKVWIEKCADEQYGVFLSNIETKEAPIGLHNESVNLTYTVVYTKFEPGVGANILEPGVNMTEEEAAAAFTEMGQVAADLSNCGASISTNDSFNKCVFIAALNYNLPSLCMASEGIGKGDLCVLLLAKSRSMPTYCEKAGSMRNDCYLEYAYANNDSSYCSLIDNTLGKENCTNALNEIGIGTPPAANTSMNKTG